MRCKGEFSKAEVSPTSDKPRDEVIHFFSEGPFQIKKSPLHKINKSNKYLVHK